MELRKQPSSFSAVELHQWHHATAAYSKFFSKSRPACTKNGLKSKATASSLDALATDAKDTKIRGIFSTGTAFLRFPFPNVAFRPQPISESTVIATICRLSYASRAKCGRNPSERPSKAKHS